MHLRNRWCFLFALMCALVASGARAARRDPVDTGNLCPATDPFVLELFDTASKGSDSFPGLVYLKSAVAGQSEAVGDEIYNRYSCTIQFVNSGSESHTLSPRGRLAELWEGGTIAPGETLELEIGADWEDGVYRYECTTEGHAWFAETSAIVISPAGLAAARSFFEASYVEHCESAASGTHWTDEGRFGLRAEWFSLLTSFLPIFIGLLGIQRAQPETPAIIRLNYVALLVFGVSSLSYHATFAYGFALFDAFAMTSVLCLALCATYDQVAVALVELFFSPCMQRNGRVMSRIVSCTRLVCIFGALAFSCTLVALAAGNEQSYQIGFAIATSILLLGLLILLVHSALFTTFLPLTDDSVLVRPRSTVARVYSVGACAALCAAISLGFWSVEYTCEPTVELVEGWKAPSHGMWHIFFALFINWLLAWLQLSSPHGNETVLVDVRWWPSLGYALLCGCFPLAYSFSKTQSGGGKKDASESVSYAVLLDQDEERRCFCACSNLTLFGVDEDKMV